MLARLPSGRTAAWDGGKDHIARHGEGVESAAPNRRGEHSIAPNRMESHPDENREIRNLTCEIQSDLPVFSYRKKRVGI